MPYTLHAPSTAHSVIYKTNEDKCHLMIFGGKSNKVSVKIGEASVKESKEEKLLGIIFDQTLSFK